MGGFSSLKRFSGLVLDRPFVSALPSALRVEHSSKLLQVGRIRSGCRTHLNVSVSLHENEFVKCRAGATRLVHGGRLRKNSRVVTAAASSTSVDDGAWVDDDGSENRGEEKKREIKKVQRRIIAGVDQSQLVDPWLLADPDSRFAEYYGVQIHHKIERPASSDSLKEGNRVRLPAILLHGFGASLFSWERVMPKLAQVFGEAVLAFDRPAFGLTSRLFPPSPQLAQTTKLMFKNIYSVAFSASVAVGFINFLKAEQAILIGHSAGSIIAAEAYHQSPDKIAAMIFVAPALMAPLVMRQVKEDRKSEEHEKELQGEVKSSESSPALKLWAAILWVCSKIMDILRRVRVFLAVAFTKLLGLLLRSPPGIWLVRRIMDKGGPAAVRIAFYDPSKADKYVLDGYTKPLGCRDWERALVEYCLALIEKSEEQISRKKTLEEITCPVLVVTGDTDRIVPDWNAERLAKVFPNAEFKRIKDCGHLPQEETPDELVEIVKDFLTRNLLGGTSAEEPADAASV